MRAFNTHRLLSLNSRQVWWLWFAMAGSAFVVHLLTIRISPTIWQDEVQIVEYGRMALWGGDHGWSVNWSRQGRPLMSLSYLSCSLQEIACRLGGVSEIGPRVSSILGAIFAGTSMLGWMIKRGCRPFAAFIAATLLLLDPVFAQSYRGARVDCWVFAFIFLTCWFIRRSFNVEKQRGKFDCGIIAAGVCLALAGLCWPSAILLVPLVLYELMSRYQMRFSREGLVTILPILLTFFTSAVITVLIFLAPVSSYVWASVHDVNAQVSAVSGKSSVLAGMLIIADNYKLSPFMLVFGILFFFIPTNRFLGVAFLVAAIGVSLTNPYIHRALYLLPYLLVSLSGAITFLMQTESPKSLLNRALLPALVLLVCWSGGLTLGARTWNAWRQKYARSPDRIMEVAKRSIGARKVSVYTPCWEFYFAGRQLGWRLFNSVVIDFERDSTLSSNLLNQTDFAILGRREDVNPFIQSRLKQAGFVFIRKIQAVNSAGVNAEFSSPDRIGATGYGEYFIYARGVM